ncbi:non-ribosomal peptide synthetase/type I polyketide synthase [Gynuella sunshinyii]|uniref:Polyketide synthase modules-related protein n=1 Tax=Gynuella sunshinyii YC6258 TaxID=1445510 RepID=A0A0C5VY19_9GAMM|nr:non-ribosomal peptide synthetase/type I polyketide synthase [Gynuella sunshinyii]AJQ95249.1 polyketide synthase modules-related protein [Gynuella sunshinyii YC6258]
MSLKNKIAIVGIGCRFPGHANDYQSFWQNLITGKDCLEATPLNRYNAEHLYSHDKSKPGRLTGGRGGYIDGFDEFDPAFFGIGPREAEYMDPQQRKLLEVAWEAMEDGGLKPRQLSGQNVGVFIGGFTLDYKIVQFADLSFNGLAAHTATGTMMTILSNRISYCFDFHGPSMSVDTACSSSLVTTHLACQSLIRGESDIALSGGVLLHMTPQYTITESKGGFLSPEGLSRTYDADANGYVRSEGVGVVALKRLEDALRDGDPIHAVIIGSGVNQDGRTNGITVPSGEAQEQLIRTVCDEAGINPGSLQYIEAHGTSTPVGDPIEANTLGRVLATKRRPQDKCYIGSVKTNIGHTEAAAGVAGLIKTVLALKHKTIPPHINLKTVNPALNIDDQPFNIPSEPVAWPEHEGPARAGVNSFGFGGTNAHVLLEESPVQLLADKPETYPARALLPLSADDDADLTRVAIKMRDAVLASDDPQTFLYHAGHTLANRRELLSKRVTFAYESHDDLIATMDSYIDGQNNVNAIVGSPIPEQQRRLVWVFTGMGPQWWAMGRQLFQTEPVYRDMIERCDELMSQHANWSLIEQLNASEEDSKMADTWLAQPANFALQVALAALWRSWGVTPEAIVGHSAGEAAAFYEAGVYSLEDAVKVIIERSRLQYLLDGHGTMLAVSLTEEEALERIAPYGERISIAAINSPTAITLAGDEEPLKLLADELHESKVFAKFLAVNVPYHSAKMELIEEELFACLADIQPQPAKIPVYLTARSGIAKGPELDAAYWWENVRYSVRFKDAITHLAKDGYRLFLEIGPHPVLGHSIKDCMSVLQIPVDILFTIRRLEDEGQRFMQALAMLHNLGYPIDWQAMFPEGRWVTLPTYPWKQDRYWVEAAAVAQIRLGQTHHPLLGRRLPTAEPGFETLLDIEQQPYLGDHRIQGNVLFPAAGFLEMAMQAIKALTGKANGTVRDLQLKKALYLPDADVKPVQFLLSSDNARFSIATLPQNSVSGDSAIHATGYLQVSPIPRWPQTFALDDIRERCQLKLSGNACYATLAEMGYHYGPVFQPIDKVWVGDNEALALLLPRLDDQQLEQHSYHFHPTLLDACFQTVLTTEILHFQNGSESAMRLPLSLASFESREIGIQPLWAYSKVTARTTDEIISDIYVYDKNGDCLARMEGFRAGNVDAVPSQAALSTIDNWLTEVHWINKDIPEEALAEPLTASNGTVLVVGDRRHPLVIECVSRLRDMRQPFCMVDHDPGFVFETKQSQALFDTASREDWQAFFGALKDSDLPACDGILDLRQLSVPELDTCSPETLASQNSYATYPLIAMAQALLASQIQARLLIVTARGQAVLPDEGPNPLAAAAWGVGRVLWYQELITNRGSLLDVDWQQGDGAQQCTEAVEHILTELRADRWPAFSQPGSGVYEGEVAWRQNQRYACRLRAAENLGRPLPLQLRPDACYLVTGAFGALGQLLCHTLVDRGARRLILMGRTALPERSEWSGLPTDHPLSKQITFVRSLEAKGVDVITAAVDVSYEESLSAWLQDFRQWQLPPIRGVFHLAGQVRDTLLADMTPESYNAAYDPKVVGSYLLHQYLHDQPLDYFVMFASVASLLTTAGQTNYAAGNAFLDALAHYRRSQGLPGLALDWGPWATGMIEDLGLIDHYRNSRGMNSTAPEAGMDIVERVLGQDVPQLMINTVVDWPLFNAWYQEMPPIIAELASSQQQAAGDEDHGSFLERYRWADESDRQTLLEEHFVFVVSDVLRIKASGVSMASNLNDLGLDSLLAIELRARIQRDIKVSLPVVTLLSGTPVSDLIAQVEGDLVAQLGQDGGQTETSDVEIYSNEHEFPLSRNQTALWFLKHLNPDGFAYNIGGAVEIRAELQPELMFDAVRTMIRRHPMLRANFAQKDGRAMQFISDKPKEDIGLLDMEGTPWEQVYNHIIAEYRKPYDLAHDPLMRFRLYRLADDRWVMMKAVHHIISDAISTFTFIEELLAVYEGMRGGENVILPPAKARYLDYVNWQNRFLVSDRAQKMQNYWLEHLPDEIPVLNLPIDKPRPAVQTNNGASEFFIIEADMTARLHQLAQKQGVTVFMVLLSTYYALLHRYSGQQNIIVGSPVMGRTEPEFNSLYGYFVNPLPLHVDLSNNPNTLQLLSQVQDTVLNGLDNQEYPFVMLVDKLGLKHDPSRSAVFQAMFILLAHKVATEQYGYRLDYIELPEEEGQFDLTLSAYEDEAEGRFHCVFKYNTDLFLAETVQRFAGHFINLLEAMLETPELAINELPMLSVDEQQQLLTDWSGAEHKSPAEMLVTELVDQYRDKDEPAVITPEQEGLPGADQRREVSYAQLVRESDRLAVNLQAIGVGRGDVVALSLMKSPDMMVSLLAVLKTGAAYLPIDPDYPEDRVVYMLDHAKARMVLTSDHLLPRFEQWQGQVLTLDDPQLAKWSSDKPDTKINAMDTAYVIFTSGSTGKPKAVQVSHGNLAAVYQGWHEYYRLSDAVRVHAQMASFSFDVFAGDWLRALCSGGSLVLIGRDLLFNTARLYQTLKQERVDCMECVPAVARGLMQYCEREEKRLDFIQLLMVGSDVWKVEEIQKLKALCTNRVVNSYGLTEATIDSAVFEGDTSQLESGQMVPVGHPFANSELYVLDAHQQPLPVGVPGELWIGGEGVALGYLGAPEMTAQRFVKLNLNGQSRTYYRTGDLAKWDRQGCLQLLGRADNQVKVRGHRIEVGEIETQLKMHPEVAQAIVTVHKDASEETQLCAYWVAHNGYSDNHNSHQSVDARQLRQHLGEVLPTYMIPAWFVEVDQLPLSPNGKVDINALPEPVIENTIVEPPHTLYEVRMAHHWKTLLNLEQVGVEQDFFVLGGSSIKLIELIYLLQHEFNVEVSVSQLFKTSTLYGMAKTLEHIIIGRETGAGPYLHFNDQRQNTVFCFPPAGGHGLVYRQLAEAMPGHHLLAFNYLTGEQKVERYTDLIKQQQPEGPYVLLGYSLGGNLAFEVAKELERRGDEVSHVVIIDSYRIAETFVLKDEHIAEFELELKEHLQKHTGSARVEAETLAQAKDYIEFSSQTINSGHLNSMITILADESKMAFYEAGQEGSWAGCADTVNLYQGSGLHADMLDEDHILANASLILTDISPDIEMMNTGVSAEMEV